MLHRLTVLLLASLFTVQSAEAQQPLNSPELVPGARVRVEAEGRAAIGGIHSISPDSVVITLWEHPGFWTLPTASIRKLEMSSGRESRWNSAFRWGWRSALVLAGLMTAMAGPTCAGEAHADCEAFGPWVVQSALSGAMMGGIYGAFAPSERWISIPVPPPTPLR